jgi:hypothetical protein
MKNNKCSQCGLVNFADAFVCKRCNYQFQDYSQTAQPAYGTFNPQPQSSYNSPNPYQNQSGAGADSSAAVRKMFFGALWAIGGTIATVLSYGSASGGGKYFVFWGAILFGAIDFLVGLNGYVSNKD